MRSHVSLLAALALASGAQADPTGRAAFERLADSGLPVVAALAGPGDAIDVEDWTDTPGAGAPLVDLNSITKTVTAVMVLHLVEAGRLSLDTTLGETLGGRYDVPADKAHLTVHRLLTHTAGLPETSGSDAEALTRDAFVARILARDLELGLGPDGYRYSNPGYSLLAVLIELAAGKTYEAYLLEDVLASAGLPPIGYAAVYDAKRSLRSARVLPSWFLRRPIDAASWHGAAPGWNLVGNGGLVTTAEGFVTFWEAFLAGKIVGCDLVRLALTPHADEEDGRSFYGYGLVVQPLADGRTAYWHDGGNGAFSAEWRHVSPGGGTLFVAGPGQTAIRAVERLAEVE